MNRPTVYPNFTLDVVSQRTTEHVKYIQLHTKDKFSKRRYKLERSVFRKLVGTMEQYLRRRPHIDFAHPKNYVRNVIYLPRTMKEWATYMPGGFATHYVHNPDHKRLMSGKRIDYITRNLFRHSADAIGLRSRAYAMTWFIDTHMKGRQSLKWLSIASGTGQATYDAVTAVHIDTDIYLVDIDEQELEYARELAATYGLDPANIHTQHLDIKHAHDYDSMLTRVQPDVVEAMGIVEYLSDDEVVSLIRHTLQHMHTQNIFVFTNMLTSHPHLQVHQRGLGWPGVIQRSVDEMLALLEAAGVEKANISVLLPDDDVYAVYAITV